MCLLFCSQASARLTSAAFTLKSHPDKAGSDTVLVGKTLWYSIHPASDPGISRCLSIQSLHGRIPRKNSCLGAITCFAFLDEEVDELAIPPIWLKDYPHIFSKSHPITAPSLLLLVPSEPSLLSEVIVAALSTHAYQVARLDSVLETWLSSENLILRHGAVYVFTSEQLLPNGTPSTPTPPKPLQYRLDIVEPVLQGIARKGHTKFIMTLSKQNDGSAAPETDNDFEGIEIGEAFLANSTFSPGFGSAEVSSSPLINGYSAPQDTSKIPGSAFNTRKLLQTVECQGDQFTLYVRTADLGRVGMLNGDWGVARSIIATNPRLVRIIADDDLVDVSGFVAGSPILLYNLRSPSSSEPSSQISCEISLHSSPFGSKEPAIPIARTVTVARVASPLSVNRRYQTLFLKSLKSYFSDGRSVVKKGDIIAVAFDSSGLSYPRVTNNDDVAGFAEDLDYRPPGFPSSPNEIVFFCVTNIEHDVMKTDSNPDLYVSSTTGELGCWLDPTITRMVQTGVEHCWIPEIGTYLESASPRALLSTLIALPYSHLLGPIGSFDKLLQIASAVSAQCAADYDLNLSVLLKGARGTGKFTTAFWVAERLGMHLLEINCYDLVRENDVKTEGILRARFDNARNSSPCICVIRHLDALSQTTQALESGKEPAVAKALQECIEEMSKSWKITGYPVITLGTTSLPDRVPQSILSCFKHQISFEAPGEDERREILTCSLAGAILAPDISLSDLATHTAALVASDLVDLVGRAKYASVERVMVASGGHTSHLVHAGIALTAADFEVALRKARSLYSESIGAPKIPNVSWDDVGGLIQVKSEILDTIQLPLDHPELFTDGLKKRSGILLYGPPGTGKTLLAKAVATSCSLNFFSVKGPELLNMYIGESEANVRRVFQRARDAKPCVVFFDELDSIAPKRGNQGDSGGVMDRIVSQLLAELDGMSSSVGGADVFVIGATNRPDLLDPALLRPGRFDRMLYLGVSDTHEAQANIIEALTRKFRLDPTLNLKEVAEQCPFNYTGADFYALCSDAMLLAMSRKAELIEEKIARLNQVPGNNHPYPITSQYFLAEMASSDDIEVIVCREDFDIALKTLVPSVSQSEMEHYVRIQQLFSRDRELQR